METTQRERQQGLYYLLLYKNPQKSFSAACDEANISGMLFFLKQKNKFNIDIGYNTSKKVPYLWTCLAPSNGLEMAKILLECGADVNQQTDIFGSTALRLAGRYGLENFVKLFLDYGADPYLKDSDGDTVIDYLKTIGRQRILNIIANHLNVPVDSL